jgi:hypothetical protein
MLGAAAAAAAPAHAAPGARLALQREAIHVLI